MSLRRSSLIVKETTAAIHAMAIKISCATLQPLFPNSVISILDANVSIIPMKFPALIKSPALTLSAMGWESSTAKSIPTGSMLIEANPTIKQHTITAAEFMLYKLKRSGIGVNAVRILIAQVITL